MLESSLNSWESIFTKCLNDLQSKYPQKTECQLASIIGISRATFNRMKNDAKVPQMENILKLLIGSDNINILNHAVNLVDKGLGEKLKKAMEVSLSEKKILAENKRLEALFENRDLFITYILCDKNSGATKDEVISALGPIGLECLNTLVDKNIILKLNNNYYLKEKGTLVRGFSSIKYHLATYARFYRPEHVGLNINYAHSLSEGLNKEGIQLAHEAHRDFHKTIKNIYRNPEYQGNITSFSVAFCDTFTNQNETANPKGEQI